MELYMVQGIYERQQKGELAEAQAKKEAVYLRSRLNRINGFYAPVFSSIRSMIRLQNAMNCFVRTCNTA